MKITMSKKGDKRGKHLVLSCTNTESLGLPHVIQDNILQGKRVVMETLYEPSPTGIGRRRVKAVVFRFHLDYMERLIYTFPHVEMSPAAERYYRSQSKDIYADLPIPKVRIPGFNGKLWNFQKVGVKWINDHILADEDCCLNDEMGLGKTVQVFAAIARKSYENVLVVTTNSGKWSWRKIASEPTYVNGETVPPMFPELDVQVIDGTKAQRVLQLSEDRQITVVNVEMLRTTIERRRGPEGAVEEPKHAFPQLFNKVWDLIVVDETHKVKNPDAQVTKGFLRLQAKRGLYMSGTPFLNRPDELWPVLHRIDPVRWGSQPALIAELVIDLENGQKAYRPDVVKEIKTFLNEYALRRRKDQVVKDLPEEIFTQILVDLNDEQRILYDQIRDEALLALDNGEIKSVTHFLAVVTRLKQACWSPELYEGSPTSAKIEELKKVVKELVESGEKAIIFSQWEKACVILKRELEEYNPAYVTGKIKGAARQAEQDKFNRDEDCKLYIGTIGANQEAITLSAATYIVFTDLSWTPLANAQARARGAGGGLRGAYLIGKDAKINCIELFARGTIEEWIEELLATKKNLFTKFIESDGGMPVTRFQVESLRDLLTR